MYVKMYDRYGNNDFLISQPSPSTATSNRCDKLQRTSSAGGSGTTEVLLDSRDVDVKDLGIFGSGVTFSATVDVSYKLSQWGLKIYRLATKKQTSLNHTMNHITTVLGNLFLLALGGHWLDRSS